MSDFLDKVKAGHPIQTRDGRPAKFIGYAPGLRCGKPLVVSMDGHLGAYDDNGRLYVSRENLLDLILAPKPKVKRGGWISISPNEDSMGVRQCTCVYTTKEPAKRGHWPMAFVEWEEEAP